jgi:GNAT superfamily N-acetyltransferase
MLTACTIRPATVADADVVAEFNALLAEESEAIRLNRAVLDPGVRAALSDVTKARYFLAECDGRVVGQTMVTYEWSDWRNGWLWWIQSVYVRPEYRRRGIFRALHEHVRESARREGAVGLRLYVHNDNHLAQQVYERLGLHRAGYHVLEQMFRVRGEG